jgi:four helix bundle protein
MRQEHSLCDQIQRAAVSIQANIAEGAERDGRLEFIRFLQIAKGSAGELRSHLYVALDAKLLPKADFDDLHARSTQVSRMIAGLISYLKQSPVTTGRGMGRK